MLPKTAEYALRAAVWLGQSSGTNQSADQIAQATKIPRRYLHKVLQDLVRAKLVRSQPGPGGGYSLASGAETISILAVINAVAPPERIRDCPLELKSHTSLCPLHLELDKVYAAAEAAFARVTLAQLLRSTSNTVTSLCEPP